MIILYFLLVLAVNLCGEHALYKVDFDLSMKTSLYPKMVMNEWGAYALNLFKELYDKQNPYDIEPSSEPYVEYIIHQIWLGSPLPEKYKMWQETWQLHHPHWQYKLWTDKDLEEFPLFNRDLYEAEMNYGARSDIARYEILYHYGGLYVDIDGECVAPFDMLNNRYRFYIGIQPLDTATVQLGIGIIGAQKYHPLLKYVIEHLRDNTHIQQIVAKTGPLYFTQVFCGLARYCDRCIALPASYFYPRGYSQTQAERAEWLQPETLAVHHWGGSWLKEEAFVKNNRK
jgi:mannosyltransferase OCH1-like enzyme